MDQIQHFIAQLKTKFAAADPGRRMIILGIPALVLIGLFTLKQALAPHQVPVASGSIEQLRAIESRLKKAGLTDYQISNGHILVADDQTDRFRKIANAQNASQTNEWEQQFAKIGIFSTRDQLQTARDIALQKTIHRAILAVPAIENVNVTWARSHRRRWNATAAMVTATVCVTPRPDDHITPQLVQSLQIAIANMVPDLKPEHVTVFDQSTGQSTGTVGHAANDRVSRGTTEDYYRDRIQSALAFLPDVNVTVTASRFVAGNRTSKDHRDLDLRPTAVANSIPMTIAQRDEIHVSVIVPEQLHSSLAGTEGADRRQKLEQTIRRIVEPSAVLVSLDIGAAANFNGSADTSLSVQPTGLVALSWSIPLVVFAVIGLTMWWIRRSTSGNSIAQSEIASDNPPIDFRTLNEIKQSAEIIDQNASELKTVLQAYPNESLSVLQQWTENNQNSAAIVAGHMDPATAAGFAARMSEDERAHLHSALQQRPISNDSSPVIAFCQQVAQSALPAAEPVNSEPQQHTTRSKRRAQLEWDTDDPASGCQPKSRLYEFPPRLIARLLDGEQPQTVAIALTKLDVATIDRILRNFSGAKSSKIRERLESVDGIPPKLADDVEAAVLTRLKSHSNAAENHA